jgi:hypothetical protein
MDNGYQSEFYKTTDQCILPFASQTEVVFYSSSHDQGLPVLTHCCFVLLSASVQLKEEYQRLQQEQLCKICMDEKCTIVFLPCGHIVSCSRCAPALRKCPICMQIIKGSVRAYF